MSRAVNDSETAVLDLGHPLVVGFGVTGRAMTKGLLDRGHRPMVCDDRAEADGSALGVTVLTEPSAEELTGLIGQATVVLPSPGIPADHLLFRLASELHTPIGSEFDLAGRWDSRPVVGITGTNGKTTVTTMVTDALVRSGIPAAAVGNTEVPWVGALGDERIQTFVVEASSFRLAHSARFAPRVATWLNFSPDHLDAHATLDDYEMAKAKLWSAIPADGIAIANAEDVTVLSHLRDDRASQTFGLDAGDWRRVGNELVGPTGPFVEVSDLKRRQPHDLSNACATAATARAAGASMEAIAETLVMFEGLPHRVQFVGEWDGVRWYNDSKATVPHATLAALGGFDSVVLIAGGKNKGLDLSPLAAAVPPVRAVVAMGDAVDEIADLFSEQVPVSLAASMAEAVAQAAGLARAGDTVLLSPSCTSFDWYSSYGQRGEDFMTIVSERFT